MAAPASLLPELEEVVQHGSAEKRAETLRRITTLFLDGAPAFTERFVAVFDDVIGYLIAEVEQKELAELSRRLASAPNAPAGVVTKLANNDDIEVGGPVLEQTNICKTDAVLAERVGTRTDIPPGLFQELLMKASEVVRKRLLATAKPKTQAEIR